MRFVSDERTVDVLDAPERFDLSHLPEVVWDPQAGAFRAPPDVLGALCASLEATGVALADQVRASNASAPSATPSCTVTPLVGARGGIDPALLARVILAGERLPGELCKRIVAAGTAAVSALDRLMECDALRRTDAPGGGHAPTHAARLLGELRATAAIPPLLRVLARKDSFDDLTFAARSALESMGPPALEPTLAAYAVAASEDERFSLAGVLAYLRVHDDRVLALLLKVLEEDVADGAILLRAYGDPAALPHLVSALNRCQVVKGAKPIANAGILALAEAIEEFMGALTVAQEDLLLQAILERRRAFAARARSVPPRQRVPGRNAPCPCGSGRKFKKCCLP